MGETAKRTLGRLDNSPAEMNQLRNSERSGEPVSFFGLFTTADTVDYLLMFFGSVGAVIHGAAMPVFFLLFGHIIDSLGQLSSDPLSMSSRVSQYSLYLVYLGLIVFVSAWMGVAFWAQTGERQVARLRLNYLEAVLKKEINFFDVEGGNKNLIDHISSDAILVHDAIGDKIGHSFRYLSQFIVGFLIGFTSVWQLTLLTLAVVPLIAIAGGAYTMIMSTLSKKCEASYAEAGKVAEEVISQIRTVYSFVGEDKAVEAYSSSLQRAIKVAKKSGLVKGIGIGFTYGLLFCAWGLLLWYASVLVRHGRTNGGKAFTTIINIIFSGLALGQAAPNLAAVVEGRSAAARILSLIKTDARSCNRFNCGVMFSRLEGKIEFCRVSFSYPSRPEVIFEDLSFSIPAGKTCAFVGPSGSGKSTIISLIQRFYDPISDKILLDGHDLRDLQLKWLREQMGLVNQEPVLFATTIAGNILYGKDDADMMQVIIAAKASNAHPFIQALPDGYNTQVGEGGIQLSGGQKQIIAIARAVLRNPKILLLDEATSALDSESELLVQNALDVIISNRTSIVVAHRLSTIREVDNIVMLNNGQVVESGSHDELMSKKGEYAALFSSEASKDGRHPCEETTRDDPEFKDSKEPYVVNQNEGEFVKSSSSRELQQNGPKLIPKAGNATPSFAELVKLNATEWPFTVLGSIGAALAGVEALVFSLGVTYILTAFYSHDDTRIKNDTRLVSFIFVGVSVVTIPIYLLQHFFYTLMGERITANVRLLMFSAILSNESGWFDYDENSVGALTSKLAADAPLVRSALADRLSTIVQNVTLTVAAFAIAFKLSWRLAALTTAMFPLLIGASIAEQLFLQGFGGDYSSAYFHSISIVREAISNIRTVAAFGAEEQISRKFAAKLNQPNKQALLRGHISGFLYGISQLFAFCSYALTLWYASVLIKRSDSNFGDIMKSFMVLIVTAFAVAETLALTPEIVKGSHALGSVFNIIHRKTTIDINDPTSLVIDIRGDVEFRSVTFRYPTRQDITVLNNLNLKILAGKSLAVVGRSGSGKSTLIALVMRCYDPGHGSILIDGSDIRSLNLKSLRLKIGLVQQEPTLFSTTIYENIRYGNEKATEIEILKAARAANAHGFISRLPEGYNTGRLQGTTIVWRTETKGGDC